MPVEDAEDEEDEATLTEAANGDGEASADDDDEDVAMGVSSVDVDEVVGTISWIVEVTLEVGIVVLDEVTTTTEELD